MAELRIVLVTPELTLFDKPVSAIRVPLFDGSAGFYPGRAPLVGRLGIGELRLTRPNAADESWFIDGGFVQVKGSLVSVLTNAATPIAELSRKAAAARLADARAVKALTEEEFLVASRELERARRQLSLAERD